MHSMKRLRRELMRYVRQAQALVQSAVGAVKLRRRQAVVDALEAERLDRIRNPARYLGKP